MTPSPLPDGAPRGDLAFFYRIWRPQRTGAQSLILLHGSGVDETTMGPLGTDIAPDATRIAVRGRIPQEDGWRWFTRITPTTFGQQSIIDEAAAFADFIGELAAVHSIELTSAAFLGYSNGANLVSSVMLLHPGLIRRAALLRAMPVLDDPPPTDLSDTRVLTISGERDETYFPFAPALVDLLREHGADVDSRTVAAGHEIGVDDTMIVRDWLARTAPASA